MRHIASAEGINITDPALALIARASDGGIRDSLTLLDQIASFTSDISERDVMDLLDVTDFETIGRAARAIIEGDREAILRIIASTVERGVDLRSFDKDLIVFFRDMLVAKTVKDTVGLLDLSTDESALIVDLAGHVSDEHLYLILNELLKAEYEVRNAFSPRVAIEMALIKTSYLSSFRDIKSAIAALSGGSPAPTRAVSLPTAPKMLPKPMPVPPPVSIAADDDDNADDDDTPPITAYSEPSEEVIDDSELRDEPYDTIKAMSGPVIIQSIIDNLEDIKLSSMLTGASASLNGSTLVLSFTSVDADIRTRSIKKNTALIEKMASDINGKPIKLEIHIAKTDAPVHRKGVKERVLAEPVIAQALDLFDGRVINYSVNDEADSGPKEG